MQQTKHTTAVLYLLQNVYFNNIKQQNHDYKCISCEHRMFKDYPDFKFTRFSLIFSRFQYICMYIVTIAF